MMEESVPGDPPGHQVGNHAASLNFQRQRLQEKHPLRIQESVHFVISLTYSCRIGRILGGVEVRIMVAVSTLG